MDTTRRQFAGMAAAVALGAGVTSFASAEPQVASPAVEPAMDNDLAKQVVSTSVQQLNKIRQEQIENAQEYVCEDGTVIDAIWMKVRALYDGLGRGLDPMEGLTAFNFEWTKHICNYDEQIADILVHLPLGMRFNITEAIEATGRDEAEVRSALDALSFNGVTLRTKIGGVETWYVQRNVDGMLEAGQNLYNDGNYIAEMFSGAVSLPALGAMPFPLYHAIPVDVSVTADDKVYAADDLEQIIERSDYIAVSLCQCYQFDHILDPTFEPDLPSVGEWDKMHDYVGYDGTHVEKCLTFGDEAEYFISIGIGRQVDKDEARSIAHRAFDEGAIIHAVATKANESVCLCSGPCKILIFEGMLEVNGDYHVNAGHYNLEYDRDLCIKCGTCTGRCPMSAIEMDDEGYPSVTGFCVRCGQCAYVCPVEARKLARKDADQIPYVPSDNLDAANVEAAWRYENGLWPQQ